MLDAKTFRAARTRLEAAGAIVSTEIRMEVTGGHRHSSRLARWHQAGVPVTNASPADAVADVVVAGVRAAVIAERADAGTWFAWRVETSLMDALVETGRLVAVDDSCITANAD